MIIVLGTSTYVSAMEYGVCRDPKDDFILECAEAGAADPIVTGDKDPAVPGTLRSNRYFDCAAIPRSSSAATARGSMILRHREEAGSRPSISSQSSRSWGNFM